MTTDLTTNVTEQYGDIQFPVNGEPRDAGTLASLFGQPVTNALMWLRLRLEEAIGSFLPLNGLLPLALSVGGSTLTLTGHGLANGDPVRFWNIGGGSSLPSPLVFGTVYYAVSVAANTFQVSATSGGGAITLTTTGSGAIYAAKVAYGLLAASAIGVLGYVGTSFTIVAGPLQTFLDSLADAAARIDKVQTFGGAGTNTFTNNVSVGGNVTCGGTMSVTGVAGFTGNVICGSGLTAATSLSCGTTLAVGTNATIVGNATVGGTLAVTGATTLAGGVAGPVAATGIVSGASVSATGAVQAGTTAFAENLALSTPAGTASFGSGAGVVFISNATTSPTVAPTGGGVLYVEAGALKYIGSSGSIHTIAVA